MKMQISDNLKNNSLKGRVSLSTERIIDPIKRGLRLKCLSVKVMFIQKRENKKEELIYC